ncbi:hypothetical protein ACFT9I_07940 [Streptomyces sp. NPDC057137]|uniref:hypothetical protein n=1 Tax=Streptomyces sp. NPDC057137 TaxID=3346030 RepID=UPI00363AACCC
MSTARPFRRPLLLLGVLLLVLLTALALRGRGDEPGYAEGYAFGRDKGPRGHLGGADASDTGAAQSECGEHAETDGVTTNDVWMAGCVDGALGLPKTPPDS